MARVVRRVIASVMVVGIALLTMTACGSTHHTSRQGCHDAVVKAMTTNSSSTTEVPQCKGLSKDVRQSIAIDILEGK